MAIQKEIWERTLVENLFADNSFLSKAYSADEWVVEGKVVHIPQAGSPSSVKKNRTDLPATVKKRTDDELTYVLSEFTTDPILIPHADTVELSYDKRTSVLRNDQMNLMEQVARDFILKWSPEGNLVLSTSGAEVDAYTPSATGKRLGFCKKDLFAVMTQFNRDNIPQEGRYLLLDAMMYAQLLDDLTKTENLAFHASADPKNGILGKLLSFNIMMRSDAALYDTTKKPKDWNTVGAATDLAAALAWHEQSVTRALGSVVAFENEKDPTYYGDIYSFLVRAGGRIRRKDGKGVRAIVQGTVAAE